MSVRSGDGNPSAKIMLVGECFGREEDATGLPFSGNSGIELNKMLHEAGITRSECYATNVINAYPPFGKMEEWIAFKKKDVKPGMKAFLEAQALPIMFEGLHSLQREIDLVRPNIIVALGDLAMWTLTGAKGIMKWRGSQLQVEKPFHGKLEWFPKLIPTVNPAYVLRDPSFRMMSVLDLRRVERERHSSEYSNIPKWAFIVRPSFKTAIDVLSSLLSRLDREEFWMELDLETRGGHIACAGVSWSDTEAICIPLMCVEKQAGYWSLQEEARLVWLLYLLLTHPKAKIRGQNLLYDAQYTYRHWNFVPRVKQDTMIAHHSVFCGLPKSLAFQASMYCDHYVYWKDDGKTWNKNVGEEQLWAYNCEDDIRTRECGEELAKTIEKMGLEKVDEFQQKMFWPVLQCMQRGVKIDERLRKKLGEELEEARCQREGWLRRVVGHPINPRSPKQMLTFFYEDLNQPKNMSIPKKGSPSHLTCDDKALEKIGKREPILRPILGAIAEIRTLGVFLSTFVLAPLDIDGRMRTSYNVCGTESFRLSSSKNAFGSGANLQNIPAGGDDANEDEDNWGRSLDLPNVRKMYVPDEGFTFFDLDLSKADLRVVVEESGAKEMKAMLNEGRDPYVEMAREFYKDPSINKKREDGQDNPKYKVFKSFAHGTHYLGTARGLAQKLGLTVHECEKTQQWYFGKNPEIKVWQMDFTRKVSSKRYVENIFGYRRYYFGPITEDTFREAIAWLPQSTIALYINHIWHNIYENARSIQVLLQVHDSLAGQFPSHIEGECIRRIKEEARIELPYPEPLVIPIGLKTSTTSWGHCE